MKIRSRVILTTILYKPDSYDKPNCSVAAAATINCQKTRQQKKDNVLLLACLRPFSKLQHTDYADNYKCDNND